MEKFSDGFIRTMEKGIPKLLGLTREKGVRKLLGLTPFSKPESNGDMALIDKLTQSGRKELAITLNYRSSSIAELCPLGRVPYSNGSMEFRSLNKMESARDS